MDESHRMALRSGLLIIEKHLHRIRSELGHEYDSSNSILYHARDNIDPKSKTKILNVVNSLLEEVRQIKETFKLEVVKESVGWKVYNALGEIWSILEDLRPEKLEAYGEMSNPDRELLRPHILKLLRILDDAYEALK